MTHFLPKQLGGVSYTHLKIKIVLLNRKHESFPYVLYKMAIPLWCIMMCYTLHVFSIVNLIEELGFWSHEELCLNLGRAIYYLSDSWKLLKFPET